MAKIKLCHSECDDCCHVAWAEAHGDCADPEVEVPDAIVSEWRELTARLVEIENYFDERVQPQLDAAYKLRAEEWRRAHPEEAKWDDFMRDIWAKALLAQVENMPKLFVHQPSFRLFDDNLIPPLKKDDE